MGLELPLIDCLEVAWQTLSLHRVTLRDMLRNFLWAVGIHEAEVLISLRIRCSEVEVRGDVAAQSNVKTSFQG